MVFFKKRLMSRLSFFYLLASNLKKLRPKAFVGWALHFFDHIETTLYLALGPILLFSCDSQNQTLWIFGLFSGAMGKLFFSFIWAAVFRFFGLRPILSCSWCGLALSCLLFGLYGLFLDPGQSLNLIVVMTFRFFQSLCSSAQTHACRSWIFSDLKRESQESLITSAFFGLSTPLGILFGLGLMLIGSYFFAMQSLWPWVYCTVGLIALGLSRALWMYVEQEARESADHKWPKLREVGVCALMSSFGYCTYYWACVFLPTQLIHPEGKLMAQTEAMAYDCLLMFPLGALSARLGSQFTLRLSTLGCLLAFCLTTLGYFHISLLRGSIMILGVLASCSHSAWLKNQLPSETFFPSSLIGGAIGALVGSSAFYWAQTQGHQALFAAAIPFFGICLALAALNEQRAPA